MNDRKIAIISAAIGAWEESQGLEAPPVDNGRLLAVITAAMNVYLDTDKATV
ncbi:MAG: hypothetical protein P3T54_08795 [Dehalogenimonas sp.]|uniref:Uncharacterized protein n=1 Tax=Candidatus Dehalogenimonas loeffleri TaxID=3127115 RepID=A0ABZ2J3J3_9CHLR|nr:hypothetical protein [Dehalogenimonas sp.]